MITDEGTGFSDDLKKKESKHESDLALLNQLYDGEGDKMTLAQHREKLCQVMQHPLQYLFNKRPSNMA